MHRFFAPDLDAGDEAVSLPRTEAEHLTRVLRLGPGDMVAVFNGRGDEFLARVVSASRRDARVQLVSRVDAAAEPAVALTLVQAVLKGEKMDDVVRDAVMLGAGAIQPVVTARTEVTVAALTRTGRLERWRRIALASVKQSRRAVLPEIRPPLTFENWLNEPHLDLTLMLVEPSPEGGAAPLASIRDGRVPADAAVLIGPEGGWTESERSLAAEAGVQLVTLGHRTLRADAVPVAAISVLQFIWGDL